MSHTILICEDEKDIRDLLVKFLQKEGFDTIACESGLCGYKTFTEKSHLIDLVLLDVMMPGLNGYEVLKRIREISNVPVIFLTARSDEEDKLQGLGLGADDYVVKPFSLKEISYRAQAQIRRNTDYKDQSSQTVIINGALELNIQQYTLKKNGEEILLNNKEFNILKLMFEHIEHVFTKKQLYEAIWNDSFYGDANTIMVHISHLREKIEDDPKKPLYLKTIRGIGYRMERIHE